MKTLKYFLIAVFAISLWGCSEDTMDEINKNVNDASSADAFAMLPDVLLKSAHTATGTDLAWYASAYIEHSAGQWAQHRDADRRVGIAATSWMNNHWNGLYDNLNTLRLIRERCAMGGPEEKNVSTLGIAQVLTAYNLAVLTDFWGNVPWSEALKGAANTKPKFDTQQAIYAEIDRFLVDGIANLEKAVALGTGTPNAGSFDYIYGGSNAKWIKAAYSLRARYHMRLQLKDAAASTKALAAIAKGFANAADNFLFASYATAASSQNPWYQFRLQRSHLCVCKTLYDIMNARTDPRIAVWFSRIGAIYVPAAPGQADATQGGTYSESLITYNTATSATLAACQTRPTPLMTFHEMKFIEAEALQRTGAAFATALQDAIRASFVFHGLTAAAADTYYTGQVAPRVATNALNEILIQKYIAMYEHEASEAYHDYRRTRVPTMLNPNNVTVGFPERNPYGLSEESANPENFNLNKKNVFTDKVWWAGGN